MLVVSVRQLAEQTVAEARPEKRLSGSVADFSVLFEAENLEQIEQRYACFGFLAFDPRGDQAIVDYLSEGTLAADSGQSALVLFTTSRPTPTPSEFDVGQLDWLDLDAGTLPAREILRHLFVPDEPPPLPGIALLRKLSAGDEAVYFPLGDLESAAQVRQHLRALFVDLEEVAKGSVDGRQFVNRLVNKSQLAGRSFHRGSIGSPRQWLISGYQLVKANAGDIIAAVGLFA
jgi:hypothetical protein